VSRRIVEKGPAFLPECVFLMVAPDEALFWRYIMSDMAQVTKDKLLADFRIVVADAEELLKATAAEAGDKVSSKVSELRSRLEDNLAVAKVKLADAQALATERTKAAADATDAYVRDNPWRDVGVAAGVGLIIGLLIGRR
jgi:ElaB/YqjD/DUF883 family membrane-anchored ribosome-binding protein